MKLRRTIIGMSVVATIVAPVALAQPPAAITDSHDRADVPGTPLVGKVITDSHDRADVPRTAFVGKVIQDSHDRADVPRTPLVGRVIQDSHNRADVPRPTLVVASAGGFDWSDAAIGAVSGMGFALLLAGLGLLLMSQRIRTRIATR